MRRLPRRSRVVHLPSSHPRVGVVHPCYGYERVSYALPVDGFEYRQALAVPLHRLERRGTFYNYTPVVLDVGLDLLHTWNALPVSATPYVVSFENELPRYLGESHRWQIEVGHQLLASDRCRGVLALSEFAATLARERFSIQGLDEIAAKVEVFRGAVPGRHAHDAPTPVRESSDGPLRVLTVGGSLFAKGFVPAYRGLERARRQGVDVEFTVIGNFRSRDGLFKGQTPDAQMWMQTLADADWVHHVPSADNDDVQRAMAEHDLFIFTSYDESLGWAPIEAGLAGTPVVSTNVFALPELVLSGQTGHVIELELGAGGRWRGIWADGPRLTRELELANATIESGVAEAVLQLADDPDLRRRWGQAARKHLRSLYDLERATTRLEEIYTRALRR